MQTKFGNGYKPRSTTKQAKRIIREEIKEFYSGDSGNYSHGSDFVLNMKDEAEMCNRGRGYRYSASDCQKGSDLVDAGCLAISCYDQSQMLSKIYGENNVANWSCNKVFNTYRNLIGREYAAMLRERKGGKK